MIEWKSREVERMLTGRESAEEPGRWKAMKILVCGGRAYAGKQRLFLVLDRLHAERPITLVIQGGATGADALAGQWATRRGIPQKIYRAEWKLHGKAAGMIRNRQMLEEGHPDLVVAFPGGSGTANMVGLARKAGVEVIEDKGPFIDDAELGRTEERRPREGDRAVKDLPPRPAR
jgi:hypothetical protein